MKYSYRKYIILAVLGSLIIGIAVYLFLNSYLEKVGIIVLQRNVSRGEIIKEEDISIGYFLKNSLPQGYLKDKSEASGKEINTNRFKGDYLAKEMFSKEKETDLSRNLNSEEILISINLDSKEKIVEELKANEKIAIVSTEKDKEMEDLFYKENYGTDNNLIVHSSDNTQANIDKDNLNILNEAVNSRDYLESSVINISENVSLIDGYLIMENIEILAIKNFQTKNSVILTNNENEITTLYLKCKIIESPYLAKLSSSGKYKILIGKNQD
ncbi:hypothetical protein LLG07_03090 [bacterium]|nr:hypothetical protein [bacterium]